MNDNALAQLDVAQHALAECKTAMEAKQILDVAAAVRVFTQRTKASVETVHRATEVQTLAEAKLGEFIAAMPKAKGGWESRGPQEGPQDEPPTLSEIGVTKNLSARSQKLAALPASELAERIAVAKASGDAPSPSRILKNDFSPEAKAAGEAAERDSENLWRLKTLWNKTKKRDRAAFLAWAHEHE